MSNSNASLQRRILIMGVLASWLVPAVLGAQLVPVVVSSR